MASAIVFPRVFLKGFSVFISSALFSGFTCFQNISDGNVQGES